MSSSPCPPVPAVSGDHHHLGRHPTTPDVITIRSLTKAFRGFRALDGLDLTVRPGEIHGFLGPNGSGKSTTIRVMLGMFRRDGGEVRVLGLDPGTDAAGITRRTAYVPGDVALWPGLTGGQVLDALGGLRGSRNRAREAELVEAFALDPTRPVRTYSKGNRQKVALVAALASPCELLVLDEPTTGLDPLQEQVFQESVRDVAAQGRTVLLSSHILGEVDRLCRRVSIIRDGRTVESGSIEELRRLTSSRIRATLPRNTMPVDPLLAPDGSGHVDLAVGQAEVPRVLRVLLDAHARDMTCVPATLEDLFLRHYEGGPR